MKTRTIAAIICLIAAFAIAWAGPPLINSFSTGAWDTTTYTLSSPPLVFMGISFAAIIAGLMFASARATRILGKPFTLFLCAAIGTSVLMLAQWTATTLLTVNTTAPDDIATAAFAAIWGSMTMASMILALAAGAVGVTVGHVAFNTPPGHGNDAGSPGAGSMRRFITGVQLRIRGAHFQNATAAG